MVPGKVIRLPTATSPTSQKTVVVKTESMEIVHLVVPAGQTIPTHEAQGEIVLHCLNGSVSITAQGHDYDLTQNELLYLLTSEAFSVKAKEESSLLVTMVARRGLSDEMIGS